MMMKKNDHDTSGTGLECNRRGFMFRGVQAVGAISLLPLASLLPEEALAATTINFTSYGGAYQAAQTKAYQEPYSKKTGIKFNNIEKGSSGPSLITAQEMSGHITWDVIVMIQTPAEQLAVQGLLQEYDYDKDLAPSPDGKPASQDFIKNSLGPNNCFVASDSYSTLFAYNKKAFPKDKAPSSVKDVFDIKKFPGTRALQKVPNGNLEWALYADGVSKKDIYDALGTPEGLDRAFKKLDTIKQHTVWWTEGAQPPHMLAERDAVIASSYNTRIFAATVDHNQPFEAIWDGSIYEFEGFVIPANLPEDRLARAKAFIRYATSAKRQAALSGYISCSPPRKSAFPLITTYAENPDIDMKPHLPTSPEHLEVSIPRNIEFWINNGPALEQRFNSWLLS